MRLRLGARAPLAQELPGALSSRLIDRRRRVVQLLRGPGDRGPAPSEAPMRTPSLLAILVTASCSHSPPVPYARYANANPVLVVNDRRDVPTAPARRKYMNILYQFNGSFR